MNYGRFFRLNQSLSKVEDGVAIYDYIDLPAYFGPSVDNPMSPKYPICVTISSDAVCFNLHYSAFKIEKDKEIDDLKSGGPRYAYDLEDINNKAFSVEEKNNLNNVSMAHMEENIIELPFLDVTSYKLSDIIKNIYSTSFPQVVDESTSMGGRYLEQLIRKRYSLSDNINEDSSIEKDLYKRLREETDNTISFSTLWLMDLLKNGHIELCQNTNNTQNSNKQQNRPIVGLLRKLLLDFMFDLKHSDVFQNSSNYQQMFSGLMSDFYFSALMHKCEYYYYRKLTCLAIEDIDREINSEAKQKRKEAIKALYANELVNAEDLWIKDIMNPQAEKEFEHQYPSKKNILHYLREFVEFYSFEQWSSWFAEPEEEMRRVCFTMKDNIGQRHICNAETLIKYLGNSQENDDKTIKTIKDLCDDDKEQVSRWFLKHYAFSDVLHLHLFKHANLLFLLLFALPALISWLSREKMYTIYMPIVYGFIILSIVFFVFHLLYKYNVCKTCGRLAKCGLYNLFFKSIISNSGIVKARRKMVLRKIVIVIISLSTISLIIRFGLSQKCNEFVREYDLLGTIAIISSLLAITIFAILVKYRSIISRLHLALPRLVASITLAWITLSMGFDLYVSYFDSIPSIPYIVVICVVVFLFVVYSINLVIPHSIPIRKILRSLELIIISYFVSLTVGFLIINFLGPKYLERGGYIIDYYDQHVENSDGRLVRIEKKNNELSPSCYSNDSCRIDSTQLILQKLDNIDSSVNDTSSHVRLVKELEEVRMEGKNYCIAAKIDFWGMHIFILRDFLVMFAFIAMFTGIFIQLIIFGDNKQMTEL